MWGLPVTGRQWQDLNYLIQGWGETKWTNKISCSVLSEEG